MPTIPVCWRKREILCKRGSELRALAMILMADHGSILKSAEMASQLTRFDTSQRGSLCKGGDFVDAAETAVEALAED